MGPDACVVLAEALRVNTVVERILLHGNPLGESGGWHLMSAITHNRYLEYIGLQGANFRPSGEAPGKPHSITDLLYSMSKRWQLCSLAAQSLHACILPCRSASGGHLGRLLHGALARA